jgi:hypothetical protein
MEANNYHKSLCVQWMDSCYSEVNTGFFHTNGDLEDSKFAFTDSFETFREAWIAGYKANQSTKNSVDLKVFRNQYAVIPSWGNNSWGNN